MNTVAGISTGTQLNYNIAKFSSLTLRQTESKTRRYIEAKLIRLGGDLVSVSVRDLDGIKHDFEVDLAAGSAGLTSTYVDGGTPAEFMLRWMVELATDLIDTYAHVDGWRMLRKQEFFAPVCHL